MILPCKDCLILSVCRNKAINLVILECSLLKDYLHVSGYNDEELEERVKQVLRCLRPGKIR